MYGLVNAAIEELVTTNFGAEKWSEIKRIAEVGTAGFARMSPYPDEITYRLVGAASKVLGVPPDDVLKTFGEFWVLYTGKEGYGHLFDMAGSSLKDFLFGLDDMHTRVALNFTELRPPSFRFEELDGGKLRMHYFSDRSGFCPMLAGLLKGLGARFKTEVTLEHPVCQRDGADHCEFDLTLKEAHG